MRKWEQLSLSDSIQDKHLEDSNGQLRRNVAIQFNLVCLREYIIDWVDNRYYKHTRVLMHGVPYTEQAEIDIPGDGFSIK